MQSAFAYKDIELVMQSTESMVDVVGKFHTKIVKMCGAETNRTRKPSKREIAEGE